MSHQKGVALEIYNATTGFDKMILIVTAHLFFDLIQNLHQNISGSTCISCINTPVQGDAHVYNIEQE